MSLKSVLNSIVIEPFTFFMALGFAVILVPLEQLQQDKICLVHFDQTSDYCLEMSKSPTSDIKLNILTFTSYFGMKVALVDSLPAIIWCLLIGSVCDRYPRTKKYFMIMTALSVFIRNALLLLNVIFFNQWGMSIHMVKLFKLLFV